ncbi:MAG: peroxidase-related enzyme [Bacteroidetes bacterium]|nr:peroxidase-related enzyme [Bacteroidota bacterium]MCH8245142.1 peroxidase-related enzyme [Bacteroidota bacterium]
MSWIETIPYERSSGRLRKAYNRVKGPNGYIDNILRLHSLRPHTLDGHMRLYKNVLHHSANELPKSLLETVGIYVSLLNRCDYCVEHHFHGLKRLLNDDKRADAIRTALESGDLPAAFDPREEGILDYVKLLTETPDKLTEKNIELLRAIGVSDGEILEINQTASYFAYANRTVLGLGCSTEGDVLGMSPGDSDDPDNWQHA